MRTSVKTTPTQEQLAPVAPDLFAPVDGEPGRFGLVGGRCPACGRFHYPLADFCPHCLAKPERAIVGGGGKLYTWTVVRTKPPFGLPEPYAVGYVDLEDSGLRVFGLLDSRASGIFRDGMAVELVVEAVGVDAKGVGCLRPLFRPASEAREDSGHG